MNFKDLNTLRPDLAFIADWVRDGAHVLDVGCGDGAMLRYLELDNLVVDPALRSSGLGSALIRHLEAFAREKECNLAVLDSYTSNHPSHRLYHRLGFEIWGFHFVKPLGPLDR